MLHPSSACPYAQPTLNTEQNWSKLEKSQSVAQTVCQADISYATQSQSQSQWVCARVCVACCVGVAIRRAPSCSSCSGTVRSLVSGNQSNRSQCYYRHTISMNVLCVCVRMIECVYRIISCVWGHISGMSSIMLPIYRSMLPGNMLQQRFHFDLIGCTSRAVLQQRHHHYMIIIIILEPSAVIDIGQRCCLLWPIGGAFVPMLAFFSISPDSFSHSLSLFLSLSLRFAFVFAFAKANK